MRKIKKLLKINTPKYSMEATTVLGELLNAYKLNQHNLVEAINYAVPSMNDAPYSQKLFFRLAQTLNQSQGNEKVREAIVDFEMEIGTSWGQNLGEIIYSGHIMGLDIERALSDLYNRVKQGKAMEEYNKRKSNEARLMIKWLTPFSYIFTVFMAVKYFNISIADFMHNQFETPTGLIWFSLVIIFYGVSIAIYYILNRRRMDI